MAFGGGFRRDSGFSRGPRRDFGPREMHKIKCSECGKEMTEDEAVVAGNRAEQIENLSRRIAGAEGHPENIDYERLGEMRDKLRSLQEPLQ